MAKHGPTPSLVGGTHGTVSFHVAGKKSKCRRCKKDMPSSLWLKGRKGSTRLIPRTTLPHGHEST